MHEFGGYSSSLKHPLRYKHLSSVQFGSSSLLERIGVEAFYATNISDVSIPSRVRELCDNCFYTYLLRLGPSSSLERIGEWAFSFTNLKNGSKVVSIPDKVRNLDG